MARSYSFDSKYACEAIAEVVEKDIRAEIEKTLRERIDPMIKEIATNAARNVCSRAEVIAQRNVIDPFGGFHIVVKFGGETTFDGVAKSTMDC